MTGDRTAPPPAVLARYRKLAGATLIRPAPGGHVSDTWQITTEIGSFWLRRFRQGTPPERAAATMRAHACAADTGLAPPPLPADTGDLVISDTSGRLFALTAHLTSHPFDPANADVSSCHRLGDALGRLHHRFRTVPSDDLPEWRLPGPAALQAALAAHGRPTCPHPAARRVLQAKLARAHAIHPRLRARLNGLDRQVIHGDVHPGNTLVTAGGPAFVDFDLARSAPPGYELMRALIYCVRPIGPTDAHHDRAAAFLRGYLTANPLTHDQVATMARTYQTVQVFDPYGLHACHDASATLTAFGHARFAVLYWLRRHGPGVTALAHQVCQDNGERP